jgi:hypothetical protein
MSDRCLFRIFRFNPTLKKNELVRTVIGAHEARRTHQECLRKLTHRERDEGYTYLLQPVSHLGQVALLSL